MLYLKIFLPFIKKMKQSDFYKTSHNLVSGKQHSSTNSFTQCPFPFTKGPYFPSTSSRAVTFSSFYLVYYSITDRTLCITLYQCPVFPPPPKKPWLLGSWYSLLSLCFYLLLFLCSRCMGLHVRSLKAKVPTFFMQNLWNVGRSSLRSVW